MSRMRGVNVLDRVVPSAYLRRVPHERGDLVQALSLHRQLAAEGVAVVEARPDEPPGLVDAGEVVAAPLLS